MYWNVLKRLPCPWYLCDLVPQCPLRKTGFSPKDSTQCPIICLPNLVPIYPSLISRVEVLFMGKKELSYQSLPYSVLMVLDNTKHSNVPSADYWFPSLRSLNTNLSEQKNTSIVRVQKEEHKCVLPKCVFSNTTKQLSQFWHHLPRDGTHRWKAQSHKSASTSDTPVHVQVVTCTHWVYTGFPWLPLRIWFIR